MRRALLLLAAAVLVLAAADPVASFLTAVGDLASRAEAGGHQVVVGRDGFLFFVPELRHLAAGVFWGEGAAGASRAPRPELADPLPAIADFARQLSGAGIRLLFVPVPGKAEVYPGEVGVKPVPEARPDPQHQAFYRLLEGQGVEVVDLLPAFRGRRDEGPPLYCRQDTHWSSRGCAVAAREIAERIGRPGWLAALPRLSTVVKRRRIDIDGDLRRMLPEGERPPREELEVEVMGTSGTAGAEPLAPQRSSPVLLLGDSHVLVFHAGGDLHARGAGLADHLARELGIAVDLLGVRGSGATASRVSLMRRRDGLAGKKVVVWCLSVRELTEGQGWMEVPVVR